MNNDFKVLNRNFDYARKTYKQNTSVEGIIVSDLSSVRIPKKEFISPNIRAAFGSKVMQNISSDLTKPILGTHLGNRDFRNNYI